MCKNKLKIKEKYIDIIREKNINFVMTDEAETGSAGEQPVRNSLSDWNGQGVGELPTSNINYIPVNYALKTHFVSLTCYYNKLFV